MFFRVFEVTGWMGGWVRLIFQDEEHDGIIHKNVAPREDKDDLSVGVSEKERCHIIFSFDTKCFVH